SISSSGTTRYVPHVPGSRDHSRSGEWLPSMMPPPCGQSSCACATSRPSPAMTAVGTNPTTSVRNATRARASCAWSVGQTCWAGGTGVAVVAVGSAVFRVLSWVLMVPAWAVGVAPGLDVPDLLADPPGRGRAGEPPEVAHEVGVVGVPGVRGDVRERAGSAAEGESLHRATRGVEPREPARGAGRHPELRPEQRLQAALAQGHVARDVPDPGPAARAHEHAPRLRDLGTHAVAPDGGAVARERRAHDVERRRPRARLGHPLAQPLRHAPEHRVRVLDESQVAGADAEQVTARERVEG